MTRFGLRMVVTALALAGAAHAKDPRSDGAAAGSLPLDERLAQQLQPALKGFEDAWNRHDPGAMAAVFAEDAVLINPSGRVARGRAEIARLFEDEQGRGMMKGTRFSHRVTGTRQLAPGLVFIDEEMTLSGARDPNGQALPDQHVHGAMLLARQQDGRWQVIEGRPYALLPAGGPRGLAAAPAAPQRGGTGSAAVSGGPETADTAHTGP